MVQFFGTGELEKRVLDLRSDWKSMNIELEIEKVHSISLKKQPNVGIIRVKLEWIFNFSGLPQPAPFISKY